MFTNGCFDLLHPGHLKTLQLARSYGSTLVVGLNSDISVRKIKGPDRPVMNQDDRRTMLLALEVVNDVIIFEEDTPAELIYELRPDVLVRGPSNEYGIIVGQEIVQEYGGLVVQLKTPVPYQSTTTIIERMHERDH